MAKKVCSICGTQFGFTNISNKLADGVVCEDCSKKILDKPSSFSAMDIYEKMSVDEAKTIIDSGNQIIIDDFKNDKKEQKIANKELKEKEQAEKSKIKETEKINHQQIKEKVKAEKEAEKIKQHQLKEAEKIKQHQLKETEKINHQQIKEKAKAEKEAEKLEAKELKEKFKENGSMDCAGKFYIDKKAKQFLIPRKIGQKHQVYDFSDLENEVRSDNYRTTTETKKKGGITRGLVGGALLGGAGAIVGASTAKSRGTSYDTLSSTNFVLTFKDGRVYQFEVPAGPLGGNKAINVVDATLASIVAENQNAVASPIEQQSSTNYDDLAKLKELVDAGILTEEEFTAKKKQILGI